MADNEDPQNRPPLSERLGMPAAMVAPPMMPGVLGVPPIGTPSPESLPGNRTMGGDNLSATGVPMYKQGDAVPSTVTTPKINPHIARAQQLEQEGSGVSQVQAKHPFWGGVLRGLDVAASVAAPNIAPIIPGTTAHHNALIQQQEGLANQDINQQEKQAQTQEIQQKPQMEQAVLQHQDELEAQKEAARLAQQTQAQQEQQQHLDQTLGQQQDRADQQQEQSEAREKSAEEHQAKQFTEAEKLANIRESGMEHRANASRSASQDKATQKQTQQLQGVLDEAQQAHVDKQMADGGNAPADVDLALAFFKTMKGTGSSGIRFTQQEQKMILGARSAGQGMTALAQKVIGEGQPLTPEQRTKMVEVIDSHAKAAQEAMDRLGGGGSAPANEGGISITRDANGRIISVK